MVQIWFQLPTYWQKKKEEEQMMSKAPMMSVASPVNKEVQQTSKPQTIGGLSNRASWIPREPMMSYAIEWTIMPWLTDTTAKNIQKYAKEQSKTPEEEKLLLNDMYQEAVKLQQRKAYEKDRQEMKAQMVQKSLSTTDQEEKKTIDVSIKLANLSDIIREWAKKEWVDAFGINDKDLVAIFWEENPQHQQSIVDYLNWKIDSVWFANTIGLIEKKEEEEEPVEDDKSNILENIWKVWIWVWAVAWWLWASYLWWWLLKSVGKMIYWLTLPPWQQEAEAIQSYKSWISNTKPKTTVQTAIEQPLIQKWGKTISSKLWQFGTRSMIWIQSEAQANNLFKNKINPLMSEADKIWISFDYKDLIWEAKKNIESSNKYSVTQKQQIISDIDEIWQNYQWKTSLKNLDLEKQWLASKIPQKYQTMAKLPNETKIAQKELASVFRNKVHSTIKSMFWVDSAKIYQDYANLKWLSKIWPKALTEAWRKWGAWNFISRVADELGTPITTIIGKLSYKAWELSQKLPIKILNLLKKSPKILYKISGSMAWAEMVDINQLGQSAYNSTKELLKSSIESIWKWDKPIWIWNPMTLIYKDMKKKWKTDAEIKTYFESELKNMEKNPYKNKKTALIDYLWK